MSITVLNFGTSYGGCGALFDAVSLCTVYVRIERRQMRHLHHTDMVYDNDGGRVQHRPLTRPRIEYSRGPEHRAPPIRAHAPAPGARHTRPHPAGWARPLPAASDPLEVVLSPRTISVSIARTAEAASQLRHVVVDRCAYPTRGRREGSCQCGTSGCGGPRCRECQTGT